MPESSSSVVMLEDSSRRRVLGLLGLGMRGRKVVVGAEQVRDKARAGSVVVALVAMDVSRHSLDKVLPILRAKGTEIIEWPSAAELGASVGRASTAAVGIVDQALARGVLAAAGLDIPSRLSVATGVRRGTQRRKG